MRTSRFAINITAKSRKPGAITNMKFVGFDIETDGDEPGYALQPWRVKQGKARIVSFATVEETGAIINRKLRPTAFDIGESLAHCINRGYTLVGSNTLFDVSWLLAYDLRETVARAKWADFKFYWRALLNEPNDIKRWGLKAAVTEFMPQLAGYEKEISFEPGYELTHDLLVYNTIDSGSTAMLARRFYDQLDAKARRMVEVMNGNIAHFAQAYLDGLNIDTEALAAWRVWAEARVVDAQPRTTFTAKVLNSPAQLKKALIEMGYDVADTSKETLSLIEDERVKAIAEYKLGAKNLSTYITPAEKCLEYTQTGRAHCQPNLWGTYTGRITYSSKQLKKYQVAIAIAQLPRHSPKQAYNPRNIIIAPPGYDLFEADAANQESRLMADRVSRVCLDTTLADIFNNGLDFHSKTGAGIYGIDYETFKARVEAEDTEAAYNRQLGKVANLSLQYRTGWARLQEFARSNYDMVISEELSRTIVKKYKTTYPGVPIYWRAAIEEAKHKGYAETIGGRRVNLTEWQGRGAYATEQTALNFPIQGSGADMKYLAVTCISPVLREYGAIYGFDLHDALFIYLPNNEKTPGYKIPALDLARLIKAKLNDLPYEAVYGWQPAVPMPWDAMLGRSWGDLKKV
jgi:DNA polymerase I-like protein with 3'-5' exonuclease and polymerase domains